MGRGIVVVQDPIAGEPLLRLMSAHSIVEVLEKAINMVLTLDYT
jgi:hypothetical protein